MLSFPRLPISKVVLGPGLKRFASGNACTPTVVMRLKDCWNCGDRVGFQSLFCANTLSCGVIQALSADSVDPFRLFNLENSYNVDESQLDFSFKELQKQLHPDKFATKSQAEQDASTAASSVVNQYYQVLRSPIERAGYMLQRRLGVDVFDENRGMTGTADSKLMGQIFMLREEMEEFEFESDVPALNKLRVDVTNELTNIQTEFATIMNLLPVRKLWKSTCSTTEHDETLDAMPSSLPEQKRQVTDELRAEDVDDYSDSRINHQLDITIKHHQSYCNQDNYEDPAGQSIPSSEMTAEDRRSKLLSTATYLAVKLKYYTKILEDLDAALEKINESATRQQQHQ